MTNKINWYPGHMNSSLKGMSTQLKSCDMLIYVLDARCPNSCLNPKFAELTNRKPVLFVLNKSDLAPAPKSKGVPLDSTKTNSSKKIVQAIHRLLPNKARIHAMVIGVPNCGKSTLINNLAGGGKTKTENKPGVTRVPRWVAASDKNSAFPKSGDEGRACGLYLLDTPGVLWPNLDDPRVAQNLAYIGSIKDDILDINELARELLKDIKYTDTFEEFCKKRGFILSGGRLDEERGAKAVLHDFRAGKFGKFNLDAAND